MSDRIRTITSNDIPAVLRAFKEIYPANPRLQEIEYLNWQFRDNPGESRDAEYSLLVLEREERFVAFLGYVPLRFQFDDVVKRGCSTCTWYSNGSDGGGLAVLSTLMVKFDNRFLIGLSDISASIYSLYKIPLLPRLPRWVATPNAEALADLLKLGSDQRSILDNSAALLGRESSDPVAITTVSRFTDDPLQRCPFSTVQGFVIRNAAYLNWRYIDIPHHRYQVVRDPDGGYAVFRIEQIMGHSFAALRIIEWWITSRWGAQAIAFISGVAREARVIVMDFFCTALEVGEYLQTFGFFRDTSTSPPVPDRFRPLNDSGGICIALDLPPHRRARELNFSQWYISKGDGDIDRVKL